MSWCLAAGCGRIAFDPLADHGSDGAPPDARCAFGPWSAPTLLSGLDTGADDWEPALHPDGELLVFNRELVGTFAATRNGTRFENPTAIAGWNPADFGPAWDPAGDSIYLTRDLGNANYRLWESSYAAGVFGTPSEIAGLTTTPAASPTIRSDGLELYYTVQAVPAQIGRAERPDRLSSWMVTGIEPQLTVLPGEETGWPTLDRDGLTLYLEARNTAGARLYVATRAAQSERFGTPTMIAELDGFGDVGDPEISTDGRTLLYAIDSTTQSDFDLYFSTRSCL